MEFLLNFAVAHFSDFATVILAAWIAYEKWISKSGELSSKIIADYKTRCEQLEDQEKRKAQERADEKERDRAVFEKFKTETDAIIKKYEKEVARLEASNDEKDRHAKDLKDLLLDKNPDVVNLLKDIRDRFTQFGIDNKAILAYQTEILEEWRDRSHKIDEASRSHDGVPTLVPTPGKTK